MMMKKLTSRSKHLKKVTQTIDLTISDNEDFVEKEIKENVKLCVKALDDEEKEKLYLKTLNDLRKIHQEKNKNTVLKKLNQPKIKKTSNTQLIPSPSPRSEYRAISNRSENIEERPWWDNPADEEEMNEVGSFDWRGRSDGFGSRNDHCSSVETVEDYGKNAEPDNYWKDDYQEIDKDCGWGFSYGEKGHVKYGHDKENISVENTEVIIPPTVVIHNVNTHCMAEAPSTPLKLSSVSRAVKPYKFRKASKSSGAENKTRDCDSLKVKSGTAGTKTYCKVIQANAETPKKASKKRLKTTAKHTSQDQTKPLPRNQPKKERKAVAVGFYPVSSTEKLPKKRLKEKRVIDRESLFKNKEAGHEICNIAHNIPLKEVEEGTVNVKENSRKTKRLGIIFEQESRLLSDLGTVDYKMTKLAQQRCGHVNQLNFLAELKKKMVQD